MKISRLSLFILAAVIPIIGMAVSPIMAANKPNILVIMGDDIGIPNISHYSHGMMGYKTPNIDRIAKEGVLFTDYYGENSCTAGRAAFITGQHVIRTGLTKVGLPGAKLGIQPEDPTLAELLKGEGYATGQFGKNHFGDRDEFLPHNHGFDEFFGNLYHLDSEEEPENEVYPKDPEFRKRFGPRGVLKATADGKIEDTGPLTKKRMETVDDEFHAAATDFIDRQHKAGKPWFCWFNSSRMHFWTHVRKENRGKSGLNEYADGMLELDAQVGLFLKQLKDLGVEDNTIVIFTTDNGVHQATWPDGGITPFRNEKTTNWEGGFRVPALAKYPGKIPAGSVVNEVVSHLDWVPTLMGWVGDKNIKEKLLKGHTSAGKTFKVHLDGYDIGPLLEGKVDKTPRKYFIYSTDGGKISAIRFDDRWKALYMLQNHEGTEVWLHKLEVLKAPYIFDLRMDPFEKATESNNYWTLWSERVFQLSQSARYVLEFASSFKDYPPRQRPASWTIGDILEQYYKD